MKYQAQFHRKLRHSSSRYNATPSSANILEEDPEEEQYIDQRNMRIDQFMTESDTLPLEPRIITLYRGFSLVHHDHPCPENLD